MHIATGNGHPALPPHIPDLDFRALLEALPAAAYTCDPEGRITYFNGQAAEAWGRQPRLNDPAELFCGSWRLWTPDGTSIPHDQCWMALCLRDRKEYLGCEIVVERPDGTRRIVEASATPFLDDQGELAGAINIVVDITHRKSIEATLREGEQRLASELAAMARMQKVSMRLGQADDFGTLLHEILDAAIDITGADKGNIQLLDSGTLRIVAQRGFEPPFLEYFRSVQAGEAACGAAIRAGERIVVEDVEDSDIFVGTPALQVMLDANARAVQSTPLFSRSGRRLGMFSTHYHTRQRPTESSLSRLDVLARQAADLIERHLSEEALRTADRNKDEFLAVLAHELRNPLAPIHNSVQILGMAIERNAALQPVVQMMERQVGHMVRLVDDLMEVSRINSGKISLRKDRIDVATVVRTAIEASQPLIDMAGHRLDVTVAPEPMMLVGDSVRLSQVISNLLINAAKFTDTGGHVSLTVRRECGSAVLSVRDTGVGIAQEMLPRVFDIFVQVDSRRDATRSGLGIGLALVKRLVDMHGGTVEARSGGDGQGSEFIVTLPLIETPVESTDDDEAYISPAEPRTQRVLVVDDNRDAAETAALLLKLLGADVRIAHNGRKALEIFEAHGSSVVILDLSMPGMSGYELARQLREYAGARPVTLVALTGWGQEEDRRQSKEAGIDFHLIKPAGIEELRRVLRSASPDEDKESDRSC